VPGGAGKCPVTWVAVHSGSRCPRAPVISPMQRRSTYVSLRTASHGLLYNKCYYIEVYGQAYFPGRHHGVYNIRARQLLLSETSSPTEFQPEISHISAGRDNKLLHVEISLCCLRRRNATHIWACWSVAVDWTSFRRFAISNLLFPIWTSFQGFYHGCFLLYFMLLLPFFGEIKIHNFRCILPVAVTRSSCGGIVVIC